MKKDKKKVVIGVSSGIAGYKIIDLITLLEQKDIEVTVIMTRSAAAIFGKELFEKASRGKVYVDLFEQGFDYKKVLHDRKVDHIDVASSADLFVIAPATANTMAKIAHGIADDFLTTSLLATTAPVLVCPSMNSNMWNHPATVLNRERLRGLGYIVLSPDVGDLACGTWGKGRLPPVSAIANAIDILLRRKQTLTGRRVLVTAGGTQEAIDTVRVITNRSSGKMGAALADTCWQRGADVTLVCTNSATQYVRFPWKKMTKDTPGVAGITALPAGSQGLPRGGGINVEVYESSSDLELQLKRHIINNDILIHNAAVSDFTPEKIVNRKLDSNISLTLRLKPAKKLLHQIKSWNPKVLLVGFKAVYQLGEKELIAEGKKKVKVSGADFIVVNDVGRKGIGFGTDDNEVYVVSAKGLVNKIEKAPKRIIASKILDWIFGDLA